VLHSLNGESNKIGGERHAIAPQRILAKAPSVAHLGHREPARRGSEERRVTTMANARPTTLVSRGQVLEDAPGTIGELRRSDDLGTTPEAIARHVATAHERLNADGYLFLPGYLRRDEVFAARRELCRQLADHGLIHDGDAVDDAVVVPGATLGVRSADLARANRALQHLLYAPDGPMIRFYHALFGEAVRHFDFTWLRLVKPGMGTASHCDLVFMGRGTHQLCTSWTPLGDIDRTLGGLIVLEGSHRQRNLTADYLATDVDSVCENRHDGAWFGPDGTRNRPELATGAITDDHVGLRQKFGGRWLTTDYRAGDLLVFNMVLVHASLDNQSLDRLRLSSDSRYQRASEPADERWVGLDPPAHGPQSARPVIC
jgi:hypothetical protein